MEAERAEVALSARGKAKSACPDAGAARLDHSRLKYQAASSVGRDGRCITSRQKTQVLAKRTKIQLASQGVQAAENHSSRLILAFLNISARRGAPITLP